MTVLTRTIRLGTILVHRGILTEDQVQRVLVAQQRSGEPFEVSARLLDGVPEPEAHIDGDLIVP